MRTTPQLHYETPTDLEILEAYIHKHATYNKRSARKIKNTLRKLSYC